MQRMAHKPGKRRSTNGSPGIRRGRGARSAGNLAMRDKTAGNGLGQVLHQRGRRMTRQRQAVFDAVVAAGGHPSAEQVFARVRRQLPHVSLATVYNSLEALVDCGQLSRVPRTDRGPARYDPRRDAHHHARCVACSKVWDIDEKAIDVRSRTALRGLKPVGYKVEVIVECPATCPGDSRGCMATAPKRH
jgi:Fur family transcriptional regulator, peroxide stress response regulator